MKRFNYTDWFGNVTEVTNLQLETKLLDFNKMYDFLNTCKVGDKWEFIANEEKALLKLECIDEQPDEALLVYKEDDKLVIAFKSILPIGKDAVRDEEYNVRYFDLPMCIDKCLLNVGQYTIRVRRSHSIVDRPRLIVDVMMGVALIHNLIGEVEL